MVKTTPGKYLNFTYEEFKNWVYTRDPAEEFDYVDSTDCAVARFLKDTGRVDRPNVSVDWWYDDAGNVYRLPPGLSEIIDVSTMGELRNIL